MTGDVWPNGRNFTYETRIGHVISSQKKKDEKTLEDVNVCRSYGFGPFGAEIAADKETKYIIIVSLTLSAF